MEVLFLSCRGECDCCVRREHQPDRLCELSEGPDPFGVEVERTHRGGVGEEPERHHRMHAGLLDARLAKSGQRRSAARSSVANTDDLPAFDEGHRGMVATRDGCGREMHQHVERLLDPVGRQQVAERHRRRSERERDPLRPPRSPRATQSRSPATPRLHASRPADRDPAPHRWRDGHLGRRRRRPPHRRPCLRRRPPVTAARRPRAPRRHPRGPRPAPRKAERDGVSLDCRPRRCFTVPGALHSGRRA